MARLIWQVQCPAGDIRIDVGRAGIGRLKFKDGADGFIPFFKFLQVAENWLVPEQAEHVPQYILGQRAVIG